jgi:UDP-N-acetylmuramoyl-tripeptide--D-alanyl-D-alanine ligase
VIPLQLREIAALTGGELHGDDVLVDGPVVTDSREAQTGSLYVARVGEHADGHQFTGAARAAGAVAALTSRVVPELPCVVVPDVQEAFARLARGVADRVPDLTIVGITGSSGKTSTKDLLAGVLAPHGETVAPVGSLNSEVGVPLTVCRLTASTRYLVAEMGASGIGHIAYLTRIAPPRLGIVLNVGSAHVGEFGSRENIATAKAELVQALPADGVAVLNADDPVVAAMAAKTSARVVFVGTSPDATVRADDIELDAAGRASFTLKTPQGEARVGLQLHGEHQVSNALAVAAVALELGLAPDDVAAALSSARPGSRWRMEVHERADGVTVVNDAYNANPDSMRAALKALAAMGHGRRTWAVLGEMLELGDESIAEHDALGRVAVRLNISRLVAVGEGAKPIDTAARHEGSWGNESTWVPDVEAAEALLRQELTAGDVVLLKSSRDAGLRWLGDRLVDDDPDGQDAGNAKGQVAGS